jgi:hypothetical protein
MSADGKKTTGEVKTFFIKKNNLCFNGVSYPSCDFFPVRVSMPGKMFAPVKQLFLLLFGFYFGLPDSLALSSPTLAELVGRIQKNPGDTASWSDMRTWFDTTTLSAPRRAALLEQTLHSI